jgi:uncharacterized coiled-coil protein SlyX
MEDLQRSASEPLTSEAQAPSLLARAVRLLLGLALAGLLGVGLGVLGYVGIPWLYRGFSDPVLIQATRIAAQQTEIVELRAGLDRVSAAEGERLADLEAQVGAQSSALAEQQEQLEGLTSELDRLQRQAGELSGSRDRLARQEAAIAGLSEDVQALQALIETGGTPLERLERRLALMQAAVHLMRARLWLIENNAGLAAEEIEAARTALAQVAQTAPAEEAGLLQDLLERLRLTLEDLQIRPLIAADDLEIAWQLLAQLLEVGPIPSPALVPTFTPTPGA